ncbi:MAG: hypothetical protein O3A63_01015 [Proteobacteria bacterium]|nr:hypothetical protein [Pseudomonadota bacterium]
MIKISDEIREDVAQALNTGKSLSAAYVDANGKPHISFYGSTHVHSADELAIWVRNPDGPLLRTLSDHPEMAFIYGDISRTVYYTFEGVGRLATDAATRDRVFAEMHPIERKFDADKKGVAVIIKLTTLTTLSKKGKQVQSA